MIHHIQRAILDRLATTNSARYGEIKPAELDGNSFTYHMKQLISDHYVSKNEDGSYALAPKGKDYIVHRYDGPALQAHTIFLIAIRRGDEWLMRERLVQPLLGMSGFIHGEPVATELLIETATKRLQEKTGLNVPLSIHSSGLIRILRDDTIESFSHAIILTGETDQDINIVDDQTGRNYWVQTSDLRKSNVLPSCTDIIDLLSQDSAHPFEFIYHI
jgi:hypothetical protein